jgi:hypothetical protein
MKENLHKHVRQQTLHEVLEPTPINLDSEVEESAFSCSSDRSRTICQWSRVKSRDQLANRNPLVYDVKDELAVLKDAMKRLSGHNFLEDPFIFNPDSFKG